MFKLIGKFLMVHIKAETNCLNLPIKWKNRISSIHSHKCIILYTTENCLFEKLKITLIRDRIFINDNSNYPANFSSQNFYGSW